MVRFDLERVVRAAVAPAMRADFSFWDCHGGTLSLNSCVSLPTALGEGQARHNPRWAVPANLPGARRSGAL
jgi:hypothetical protein